MRKFITVVAALASMTGAARAEQLWLTMDYVRPYKLETPAQNIIIGNPAIADITVQDANNLLFFGKAPGITNVIITDEEGKTVKNMTVRVRTNANDMLTFYRGSARSTYNCLTNCEATITVGDDPTTFAGVAGQVTAKFGQAKQGAENSTQVEN